MWQDNAECRHHDPEVFYPTDGDNRTARVARSICAACPVIERCLEHALTYPETYGIWGGFTPKELMKMRAARRKDTA